MMKKVILLSSLFFLSAVAFSQKKLNVKYKIGLSTGLPTDLDVPQDRIILGSTSGEASTSFSKKINGTLTMMYTRCLSKDDVKFAQIPVMVGAKYAIDNMFYFGASAGITYYNKSAFGSSNFIYSPYIGMQIKKISLDARYFNTVRPEAIKLVGLVFSYSL